MYSLLIVDDDPWVREWLAQHIHWNEYGFSDIHEAVNGLHAMEIISRKHPHIVLTDIKMDGMDGLLLLEKIRKEYPDIRVILLSGYNEFEYARTAIKNGAVDYLLKPVEEKELIVLIKRVLKEIDQEYAIRARENQIAEQLEQSIPIMQENFIKELLSGNISESNTFVKELTNRNLNIVFSVYYIIVFEIDNYKSICKMPDFEKKKQIKKQFRVIVEELLNKNGRCISFSEGNRLVVGFNPQSNGLENILGKINSEILSNIGNTVSIGVSRQKSDVNQAHKAYTEALEAIKGKFYSGTNQVFYASNLEPVQMESSFEIIKKEQLLNSISVGDGDKVKLLLDEIVAEIIERKISYDLLQFVLVRLIGILDDSFEKAGINRDTTFINYLDMNVKLEDFETVEEFKEWLSSAFLIGIEIIHGNGSKRNRKIIEDSIEYIKMHIQEDFSLDVVAKILFVNPAYLSRLFKREVGETFTHYMMKLRIENAKKLLKDSYLKIYEISEQVGYKNERYFSRIFKDFEGITPNEYRDRIPGIKQ